MTAAKKKGAPKFRVNWRLEGLTKEPLEAGAVVELTEEKAAPFIECGVLSSDEPEDA